MKIATFSLFPQKSREGLNLFEPLAEGFGTPRHQKERETIQP